MFLQSFSLQMHDGVIQPHEPTELCGRGSVCVDMYIHTLSYQ